MKFYTHKTFYIKESCVLKKICDFYCVFCSIQIKKLFLVPKQSLKEGRIYCVTFACPMYICFYRNIHCRMFQGSEIEVCKNKEYQAWFCAIILRHKKDELVSSNFECLKLVRRFMKTKNCCIVYFLKHVRLYRSIKWTRCS